MLSPLIDVRAAMHSGAILLHDELTTTELGEKTDVSSNIATHIRHEVGDVKKGFAAADLVVEREFKTARFIKVISSPIMLQHYGMWTAK
ncbi:MAG: hypothetical protein Ct9H300mP27_00530 [Chloroflexota bacterium]|nr:MAG: hypothetical protein Ct9H300mP27_00530 [Chloroflexota bacterium]